MDKAKISVIIPIHNEEKNIEKNLSITKIALGSLDYEYEIIAVNDGSDDDTELILSRIKDKRIKVFNKPVNQGKGAAVKTGMKIADGDYFIILDADLQIHPSEIQTFFNHMYHDNADVVIGNKRHSYSNVHYSFKRKFVSNVYHWIIKLLFGFPLSDTQCGLKLFKKEAIYKVMDKSLCKRFAFDLELLVSFRQNDLRVVDAPVKVSRQKNVGSVKFSTMLNTLLDTLAIWWREKNGYYGV